METDTPATDLIREVWMMWTEVDGKSPTTLYIPASIIEEYIKEQEIQNSYIDLLRESRIPILWEVKRVTYRGSLLLPVEDR